MTLRDTLFVLFTILPALSACTAESHYTRPEVASPPIFVEGAGWKVGEPRDNLPRSKWWTLFGDPLLNALQEKVDISNQTLRVAEAQFRQSQALVQGMRAGNYPSLSGGLSAQSNQDSASQALSIGASWEINLWGRVRRLVEAGENTVEASAADLESARLSAHAGLSQNYFLLRVKDTQKRLLDDTSAAYEKFLHLTRNRYAAGVAARGEVIQAESQFKAVQAQAIEIGVQRAQLEHAIALLIGKAPADFSITPARIRMPLPTIPVFVPSEWLERRPDIAAAERRAAAASAQIGAAQSAFFPILTLSASSGFQSQRLADWFSLSNPIGALGSAIAQNLFDGGLKKSQSEQAAAAYDASVASYRQAVLAGFAEVEDQLASLRILEKEAEVQEGALQAARQSVALTANQYAAGTVSYLNVLMAQASLLAFERAATEILEKRLIASVLLIKALGGGWEAATLPNARDRG